MNTLFAGKNRIFLNETGSTQDYLSAMLSRTPPAEGTLVQSRFQMLGRGMGGNEWHSESGKNLLFSLVFYPAFLQIEKVFALSEFAALAINNAIRELLPGANVMIKWPNDILINRKKIAGILIQNQVSNQFIKSSIIGIGMNVNQTHFREEFRVTPTSLKAESGAEFSLEDVLGKLIQHLEALYLSLKAGNYQRIRSGYLSALFGMNETMEFNIAGIKTNGIIRNVDPGGSLEVETENGLKKFAMKEIQFIL